jgi:EAL domain-containing protein (putative c-di-GMP-specific phosphodiesterase class I)
MKYSFNKAAFIRIKCKKCGAELIVPQLFKNFQLTEIIEEYKFFKKYRGYDLNTDKDITVSILNKKFPQFRDCLEVCRKEAVFIKENLKNENIVPIAEFGEFEDTFYLVSPYFECFRLSDYDPEVLGEFEVNSVLSAFNTLGSVLKEIHHNNIIHHNICPENILIDNEGNVKIQNLLISRVTYEIEAGKKGKFSVSPFYISPEKVQKHSEDKKGDIFSLGVLLYFMLTGSFPFDGESNEEIIFSRIKVSKTKRAAKSEKCDIEYKVPVSVSKLRREVSLEYSEFVETLLQPYPIQRPTANGFVSRLIELEEAHEKQKIMKFHSKISKLKSIDEGQKKHELGKALEKNNLSLHYQPIVNIKTKEIIGFEALIRWPNSPSGNVTPDSFIPEAEESNLINELGFWIIDHACQQLGEWKALGFKDLYVTINLSPAQVKKDGFEDKFLSIIKNNNTGVKNIEFELSKTEHSNVHDISAERYTEIAKMFNIRVSLKELGEKYFSIRKHLNSLHLNSLKIDSEYFSTAEKMKNEVSVFRSIVALANFLSVKTIGEKVESKEQAEFLSEIGCNYGQGFYFYHPMESLEINKILKESLKS